MDSWRAGQCTTQDSTRMDRQRYAPTNKSGVYYKELAQAAQRLRCWASTARRPFCRVSLDTDLTGQFHMDGDGELWFEPSNVIPSCRLRRFNASEARSLLRRRVVAFMGDSLTRYAFINLGAFLVRGKLMERYAGTPDTAPSLNVGAQFRPTVNATAEALWFRGVHTALQVSSPELNSSTPCDNKYEICGVRVQLPEATFGVNWLPLFGLSQGEDRIVERIHAVMRHDTDILFANHGAWSDEQNVTTHTALWGRVFEATRKLKAQYGYKTHLVWRTTFHKKPLEEWMVDLSSRLALCARQHGWHVFDLRKVTSAGTVGALPYHWDDFHVLPFMNDQINDVVLNLLHTLWQP